MALQIVHPGTLDSPTSDANCFYNPLALAGTPAPNVARTTGIGRVAGGKISIEGQPLQAYNSAATPQAVPGVPRTLAGCTATSRTFTDGNLKCQKVKFNGRPIAQVGDYSVCGNTSQQRTCQAPGIGATIHIGTRRSG